MPIDDEHTWTFGYLARDDQPFDDDDIKLIMQGAAFPPRLTYGTYTLPDGYIIDTPLPVANKDNDYLIDRAAQRSGKSYSGVEGFGMQDASIQESMGPIVDRTKENLVSTDNGIIMARHRLLRSIKALMDKGEIPPGVDPAHQRVRSAAVVLPRDQAFKDAAREALMARRGIAPASV